MARKAKSKDATVTDSSAQPAANQDGEATPKADVIPAKRRTRGAAGTSRSEPAARAKTKRPSARRARHSDAERQQILEAAVRDGLTGAQVSKRFGISTLTYYNWRKKAGSNSARKPGRPSGNGSGDISNQIREALRAQIRQLLPQLIEEEIGVVLRGSKPGRD